MGACAWAGAGSNDQPSASAPARLQSKMDIGILLKMVRDGSCSAEISLIFSKLGRTCQGVERAGATISAKSLSDPADPARPAAPRARVARLLRSPACE